MKMCRLHTKAGTNQQTNSLTTKHPRNKGLSSIWILNFFHIQSILNKERRGIHYKDHLVSPPVIRVQHFREMGS
jgi:carbonic anhydrase